MKRYIRMKGWPFVRDLVADGWMSQKRWRDAKLSDFSDVILDSETVLGLTVPGDYVMEDGSDDLFLVRRSSDGRTVCPGSDGRDDLTDGSGRVRAVYVRTAESPCPTLMCVVRRTKDGTGLTVATTSRPLE